MFVCYSSSTIMKASLGVSMSIPEHSISEDKKSEILNTSRLWPTPFLSANTVMLATRVCCRSAPCLGWNVINFVSLTKSWSGWAGWK